MRTHLIFCLDLYKDFDLDRLILCPKPTKVRELNYVEESARPEQTGLTLITSH
jgi:hypothetical protein